MSLADLARNASRAVLRGSLALNQIQKVFFEYSKVTFQRDVDVNNKGRALSGERKTFGLL